MLWDDSWGGCAVSFGLSMLAVCISIKCVSCFVGV